MNLPQDQRGVVLFLTVLVMGTVAVSVLLGLTQGSINSVVESRDDVSAVTAREITYGCLEEVFIQLAGDPAWSETNVTLPDASCTVTITPNGSTLDILVTTVVERVTRGLTANITVDPFVVNDLEEALSF